jgi:methanogenic corrinoid protein MtbC1
MRSREDILKDLADSVLNMNEDKAAATAQEAIDAGLDAFDAITNGLVVGMNKAGELYDQEEYFVPELLICSDALYLALDILKPHLKKEETTGKTGCVIGVVEGDTHDIGKNLGRNVPLGDFIEKAKEVGAKIICLSTLMTTTMDGMATVIEMLKEEGIRSQFKVLVGGGPISQGFADRIGADGYAANASRAVEVARSICADSLLAA